MNEAFSDIVGAVVETLVNDSVDRPDFDIGEMLLGNKLRSMEFPAEGGRSIDTVCDYKSNFDVHHTSGPVNKAYVTAVRACERSGCSASAGCTVLIGTIFMYANIQLLTSYSTYLDGAAATCSIVSEYFDSKSPETQCSEDSIATFIKQGWESVNVGLDDNCQATACCFDDCHFIPSSPQFPTSSPTQKPPSSSLQPTALLSKEPTLTPTSEGTLEGDETLLLRIFKILFGGLFDILGIAI